MHVELAKCSSGLWASRRHAVTVVGRRGVLLWLLETSGTACCAPRLAPSTVTSRFNWCAVSLMAGVMSLGVHRSHSLQIWGYQLFREQCHRQRPAHRLGPGGSSEEDALKGHSLVLLVFNPQLSLGTEWQEGGYKPEDIGTGD